MREINGIFTDRLKQVRKSKGISLREMARKLDYNSPSSYMYIEKGEVQPSIYMMNKISKILDKPVNYFFKLNVQDAQTKSD